MEYSINNWPFLFMCIVCVALVLRLRYIATTVKMQDNAVREASKAIDHLQELVCQYENEVISLRIDVDVARESVHDLVKQWNPMYMVSFKQGYKFDKISKN